MQTWCVQLTCILRLRAPRHADICPPFSSGAQISASQKKSTSVNFSTYSTAWRSYVYLTLVDRRASRSSLNNIAVSAVLLLFVAERVVRVVSARRAARRPPLPLAARRRVSRVSESVERALAAALVAVLRRRATDTSHRFCLHHLIACMRLIDNFLVMTPLPPYDPRSMRVLR